MVSYTDAAGQYRPLHPWGRGRCFVVGFEYLDKGLCGLARAHQAGPLAEHLGAAPCGRGSSGPHLRDLLKARKVLDMATGTSRLSIRLGSMAPYEVRRRKGRTLKV